MPLLLRAREPTEQATRGVMRLMFNPSSNSFLCHRKIVLGDTPTQRDKEGHRKRGRGGEEVLTHPIASTAYPRVSPREPHQVLALRVHVVRDIRTIQALEVMFCKSQSDVPIRLE